MKITAYPLPDQAVAIKPAPKDRAWATEIGAVAADLALSTAGGRGWGMRQDSDHGARVVWYQTATQVQGSDRVLAL